MVLKVVEVHGLSVCEPDWAHNRIEVLKPYLPSDTQFSTCNWWDIFQSSLASSQEGYGNLPLTVSEMDLSTELATRSAKYKKLVTLNDFASLRFGLYEMSHYLKDDSLREKCWSRFDSVVKPILSPEDRVAIIAHSWGSVLAYEAIRHWGLLVPQPVVLITCGCPLAWNYIRHRLTYPAFGIPLPGASWWLNLDMEGDIIGGSITANFKPG